jgi:hypothetical protein
MKKSSIFEQHKEGHEDVENEGSGLPRSHITDKMLKQCRIWGIQSTKLIMWKY